MTRCKRLFVFLSALMSSAAYAGVVLVSPSSGPLAKVTAFLQDLVDFLGGAGSLFVVFIGAVFAIGLWVFAPKKGGEAIAWLFRACAGAILLFSIGTLITWLQAF